MYRLSVYYIIVDLYLYIFLLMDMPRLIITTNAIIFSIIIKSIVIYVPIMSSVCVFVCRSLFFTTCCYSLLLPQCRICILKCVGHVSFFKFYISLALQASFFIEKLSPVNCIHFINSKHTKKLKNKRLLEMKWNNEEISWHLSFLSTLLYQLDWSVD